ncbi:MAG: hypothetical protein HGN29_11355 [Asgard group archaeon]|nr:hypothetical protein [Asgard group archaeon]
MNSTPTDIIGLLEDETEFSIIIALFTFKSQNLKHLSRLLDIPESTLLRKLKNMIKNQIIMLDQETTINRRGKFYTLTPKVKRILDTPPSKPNDTAEDNRIFKIRKSRLYIAISSINLQLAKMLARYIQIDPEIMTRKEKQGATSSQHTILNFQTLEEIYDFRKILQDFYRKIEKYEKTEEGEPRFKYSFHHLACPIGLLSSQETIDKIFSFITNEEEM